MATAAVRKTKKTSPSSGYRGVSWSTQAGRWIVGIAKDGKPHHLGLFDDEREGARTYDRAARALFGDAAVLNFPRSRSLAPATPEQLRRERDAAFKSTSVSRFRGVFRQRGGGSWTVRLRVAGRAQSVSGFETEEAAAIAYDRLVLAAGGRAARLNFPDRRSSPADAEQLRRENVRRRKKQTSSRYVGVAWRASCSMWMAHVEDEGVGHHLGSYEDERDAALAYDRVARKLHGARARLNFPDGPSLAPATPDEVRAERQRAFKRGTSSSFRGVVWLAREQRWNARVKSGGKTQSLGDFDDEEEAARAYDRGALALHGAAAVLNFPERRPKPACVADVRRDARERFKATTTSRYRGVHWSTKGQAWCVQIRAGKVFTVGRYDDEHVAARAYDQAALSLHGERAVLNFPLEAADEQGR